MKHIHLIVIFLNVGILLGGCAKASPESVIPTQQTVTTLPTPTVAVVDTSGITAHNYPRVDGSTSTYPLQIMIACKILDVRCAWTEVDFFNSTRRIAPVNNLLDSDENEAIFNLYHSGTHGAYMNLVEKNADLILVAREPSGDELDAAAEEGVALDVQPMALDGFVFLVHSDNPVESLTLQQIRDIYSGRITNWADVGGLDTEIHTYQRNPNSGSQELMEKLVMYGEAMLDSPDMILLSMMGPFSAIRDDPLGIGYSVYFYAANIFPDDQVKLVAIEGISPDSDTIATEQYPLVTEVLSVMRANTHDLSHAHKLRDWILTEVGQEAVKASGYVGYSG